MYLNDEEEIKKRLEKLIWKQVDLFEELDLGLQSGGPERDTAEWAYLKEIKMDIGQLELEARKLIFSKDLPVVTNCYYQSVIKTIDEIPVCENEIPF